MDISILIGLAILVYSVVALWSFLRKRLSKRCCSNKLDNKSKDD